MTNETLFEFEGQKTGRETAMLLRELADGLADGTSVELADDERSVTIDAPAELSVEIELERETDEDVDSVELELELEWEATTDDSTTATPEDDTEEATDTEDRPAESAEATDPKPRGESSADAEITAGGESKSLARFQVFRDRADEWRWRLVHRNGNIIATSGEGYTTRRNAEKGLDSVVANAPGADVEDEF